MKINSIEAAKKIFERYENKHDIVSNYFGLLAYYALAQSADCTDDKALIEKCVKYLKLYPDNFPHPRYNFEAYRVGGIAKAWLFLKGYMPESADELRKYALLTMSAPHSKEGIISNPNDTGRIWIDTVAFVTTYMLYTGKALCEESFVDYAADLCLKSYDIFLDKTNGLLHQAKGFLENRERISSDHWGRGNGWGYLGLSELVRHLQDSSPHKEKAIEYYIAHSDALIENQTERGLWRQEIPEELSWYESSGTGLILYGLGVGIRCGILKDEKYIEAFKKGIEALAMYCVKPDFMTRLSCPGCLCPGTGKERGTVKAYLTEKFPQDDEPHSYGSIMLALVEAYKNGITEIEIP